MSNIYDPSDIDNNINGFNVVECCQFKPINMYIMIPNIGYGFLAHVVNTFEDKSWKLTPGTGFSLGRSEDSERNAALIAGTLSPDYSTFVPSGTGLKSEHFVMKIPLNSPCARKVKVTPSVRLPIPFKVRDTGTSGAGGKIRGNAALQYIHLSIFGITASIFHNTEEDISSIIASALPGLHIRSLSDIYMNKPPVGGGDIPTDANKFTGSENMPSERVEFTHFFKNNGDILHNKEYQDVIGATGESVAWGECLLRPSVFVSYLMDSGKPRLFYSPELTQQIMSKIEIRGVSDPPTLRFSKMTYAFGIDSSKKDQMQPWIRYIEAGSESTYISQPGLENMYLESMTMPKTIVHNSELTSNIDNLKVLNRTTGIGEQEETITLLTPGPPLFTKGEIYRDSPLSSDNNFYLPFSQSYLLPLASYARSATDVQEGCMFCGGTGNIGYTYCAVCHGGEGIRCPRCITNEEDEILMPGYNSRACPICADTGNEWEEFSLFSSIFPASLGFHPCPNCAMRAKTKAMRAADTLDEFRKWLGKESDGSTTCNICNGSGSERCPGCVNNELPGPPGIQRAKCPVCHDNSTFSSEYKGFSTPKLGYMICGDDNLNYAAGESSTSSYYQPLKDTNAPTCDGNGYIGKVTCPACNGAGLCYKFRGIDFDSNVDPVDERYDEGIDYTISATDVSSSDNIVTNNPMNVPHITQFNIGEDPDSGYNIALYIKLPVAVATSLKSGDPYWRDDAFVGVDDDSTPYKWIPQYMFNRSGTRIQFFRKLPEGTVIKVYSFPPFFLTGTDEDPGYKTLDDQNAPAVVGTLFDNAVWCYVKDTTDVPIISGINCVSIPHLQHYTYMNKKQMGDSAHELYHREGFAHLAHAIYLFYRFVGNTEYWVALENIGTARAEAMPLAANTSRWLYAPADPSRTLMGNIEGDNESSWIKLTTFEDMSAFEPAFKIAHMNRSKTFDELQNPTLGDSSGLLKPSSQITPDNDVTLVSSLLFAYTLRDIKYCEAENEFIFTHITKGSADRIISNSSSAAVKAGRGAPITHNPIPPSRDSSESGDRVYRPFNPALQVTDIDIASDNSISVSSLFSSCIVVDEAALSKAIIALMRPLGQIAEEVSAIVNSLLVTWDANEGKLVSPEPLFSIGILSKAHSNDITTNLQKMVSIFNDTDDRGSGINTPAQRIQEFVGLLNTFSETPTMERPANLTDLAQRTVNHLMEALILLSQSATRLLSAKTVDGGGSDELELTIAVKNDSNIDEMIITEADMKKGLLVYNIRKTYLIAISTISLLVATIERTIVYIKGFDKKYDPFPDFISEEEKDLQIYGFMTEDGKYCYPRLSADIDLTNLDITTVKVNEVTSFLEEDTIVYDIKLTIPEITSTEVLPIAICGFGIGQDGQSWFSDWNTKHKYSFETNGIFSLLSGDSPELDMQTDLNLASLSSFDNLKETLSMEDYMTYEGSGIRYIGSNNIPRTVDLTAQEFGSAFENGSKDECSSISRTEVEGSISMSEMFPYLASSQIAKGVVIELPPTPGGGADLDDLPATGTHVNFTSGLPRGPVLDKIAGSYVTKFQEEGVNIFVEPTKSIKKIRESANQLRLMLSHSMIVKNIFDTKSDDSNYQYIFPILGQSSISLSSTTGDSALVCYLLNEAGITLNTRYLDGNSKISDSEIAKEIGNVTDWKERTLGDTNDIHNANYNIWLSKRRAYYFFITLIAILFYDRIDSAAVWSSKMSYKKWDIVKYGEETYRCTKVKQTPTSVFPSGDWESIEKTAELDEGYVIFRETLACTDYLTEERQEYTIELIYSSGTPTYGDIKLQPFHCYGFGSLFQGIDTTSDRKTQRVVHFLSNPVATKSAEQLWTFSHMQKKLSIPLVNDITGGNITMEGQDVVGGWPVPIIGTDNKWKTTKAPGPSGESATNLFVTKMCNRLAASPIGSKLEKVKDIAKSRSKRTLVGNRIQEYISTEEGIKSFAISRSTFLTGKIWLTITKKTI